MIPGADARLLLDTHAFVWALTAPERLAAPACAVLEDPSRVVLLSAASIWEIAIKVERRRWPEAAALLDDLDATLRRLTIAVLPIGPGHARLAGLLAWDHRDPFDRMLAAQAIIEDAVFVTADHAFATLPAKAGLKRCWDGI